MKKIVRLYWQVALFPVLYAPYQLLNQKVLVKVFGCGCPVMTETGIRERGLNANGITIIFWYAVSFIVLIISIVSLKRIEKIPAKIGYLLSILAACLVLSVIFISHMKWD